MTKKNKPPKKAGALRLSYIIPSIIIITLIVLFNVIFADLLIKRSLITLGEITFGAKVEISHLDLRFSNMTLTLQNLAIANKDQPMTNLLEIKKISGGLKLEPLLLKRINIPELELTGLTWGTTRSRSGALSPAKQNSIYRRMIKKNSPTDKLLSGLKNKAQAQASQLPAWQTIQDSQNQIKSLSIKDAINPDQLYSVKQAKAKQQAYQDKSKHYQEQLEQLQIDRKLNQAKTRLNELKSIQVKSLADASQAKTKIDEALHAVNELNQVKTTIQKLKQEAEQDLGDTQKLNEQVEQWQARDRQMISEQLNLPNLSFANIGSNLAGPIWMTKIMRFIELVNMGRRYLPSKKPNAKKSAEPRMKGMDVVFYKKNQPPKLLINKINLSGSTGGSGKTNEALAFTGTINNICSEPALLKEPLTAVITGRQSTRRLSIKATLDHRHDLPKDSVVVTASGLSAQSLNLPSSDYFPDFNQGELSITSQLTLTGDDFLGQLNLALSQLGHTSIKQPGQSSQDLASDLWKGIDQLELKGTAKGKSDQLSLSVSSNLDRLLAQRLQGLAGEKLSELQNKLTQEINQAAALEKNKLFDQQKLSQSSVLENFNKSQQSIEDQINALNAQIKKKQAALVPGAAKKKEAEDKVKKGLGNQLKKLF